MKNPNLTADDLRAIGERVYFNRETLRATPHNIAAALRLAREMVTASESLECPEWCSSGAIDALLGCVELASDHIYNVLTVRSLLGEDDGELRDMFGEGAL